MRQQVDLSESLDKIVFQKSILAQVRQLPRYFSNDKGYVAGFVRELTFAKLLYKHFMRDKVVRAGARAWLTGFFPAAQCANRLIDAQWYL